MGLASRTPLEDAASPPAGGERRRNRSGRNSTATTLVKRIGRDVRRAAKSQPPKHRNAAYGAGLVLRSTEYSVAGSGARGAGIDPPTSPSPSTRTFDRRPAQLVRQAHLVRLPAVDGALARGYVADVSVPATAEREPALVRVGGSRVLRTFAFLGGFLAAHALARVQRGDRSRANRHRQTRVCRIASLAAAFAGESPLVASKLPSASTVRSVSAIHERASPSASSLAIATIPSATARAAAPGGSRREPPRSQPGDVDFIRDQRQQVHVVVGVVHGDDPVGEVQRRVGDGRDVSGRRESHSARISYPKYPTNPHLKSNGRSSMFSAGERNNRVARGVVAGVCDGSAAAPPRRSLARLHALRSVARARSRAARRASPAGGFASNVSLVPSARTDTRAPGDDGGGARVRRAAPRPRALRDFPALSRSGRGSAYTSLRHRPPPLPPINENLDRGHRPAQPRRGAVQPERVHGGDRPAARVVDVNAAVAAAKESPEQRL